MKLTFQRILFAAVLGLTSFPVATAARSWQGSPFTSTNWSNPGNWDPRGVPQDGEDLYFHDGYSFMHNDSTNLTVKSLRFSVNTLIRGANWKVRGNPLTVTSRIEATFTDDEEVDIDCGVRLGGNVRFEAGYGAEFFPEVGLHLNGPIDLNGFDLLLIEQYEGGDLDVSGAISGNGNLHIIGDVELEGEHPNTFTGTVYLHDTFELGSAQLTLDKISGPAVPGLLMISNSCSVKLQRPHQIADTTTVVIHPNGNLRLDGHTETIAGLSLSGNNSGAPLVETGDATLSVMDNITFANTGTNFNAVIKGRLGLPAGNHLIHVSGPNGRGLDLRADIIGDGGFTKTGEAGLLLGGNSSFGGDAILQAGRVEVSHANALGSPSGATILDGGSLTLRGLPIDIGTELLLVNQTSPNTGKVGADLGVADLASWAGPVVLNTNLVVNGGRMAFLGPVSGPAGLHILNAGTHLSGPEPNTYQGATLVFGPLLELNKPSGVRALSSKLEVHAGGGNVGEVRWQQDYQSVGVNVTLFTGALINLNSHRDDFGPITFNSGAIATGTGELGVYGLVTVNPSSTEATIDGQLGLPPGDHEFRVGNGAPLADLVVHAAVVGSGHLRKTGPGQMWLNASNTYTGLTLVEEGALVAFNADALGASSTGTTVNDGASLILNATGTTVREPIALRGAGDGSHGALNVFGQLTLRNPFPSIFACLDLTTNATIRVEPGGALTADGFISGLGPLTKTGPGTLAFANANTNSYSGDTIVREGTLELRKPNFAVAIPGDLVLGPAPLNSSATLRFFQNGGVTMGAKATVNAGALLDLNGFNQTLARLDLNDGGDAQTGPGLLSFPLGGLVAVGSLSQLGSHSSSYLSGNLGLPANATLAFAVGAYAPSAPFDFKPELEMFAQIGAPIESPNFERAGIAKSGPGTMLLAAGNSFNGRVDVLEGTLLAAHNTALGSSFDGTFVLNHATLALHGPVTVSDEILVLGSAAAPALDNRASANGWNGRIIMNQSSTVGVATDSSLDVAGAISGTRNFTKIGAGTLLLSGSDPNSYDGETFINEGTLLMNKPFTVTAIPGPLSVGTSAGGPALAANLAGYQVVGNIFINRGGLLNLNGQEENVDHLWLSDGGDVETTTGTLYLKTGGSIQVRPGTVSDVSTITGNLDFNPGAHVLNIGAGLRDPGEPDLLIPALITSVLGAVDLQKNGPGTLRLTGNNSYSGSTVVAGGILQVDGNQSGSSVAVQSGAQLMGTGRVGALDYAVASGVSGVVAPGHSPGVLSCANFNPGAVGGRLRIELNGTTPGVSGYDQLYVRGALGLARLDGVSLDASLNFSSAVSDQFIILRKDGVRLVTGEFTGLPEGGNFYIGGEQFTITYTGGDGNDVVLTRIPTPPRPALTIERVAPSSVRLLWPTGTISEGYTLQSTTNLSLSNWAATLPLPVLLGTNNVVTNATTVQQQLYRLLKP